jgi:hypothetical protein
LDCIFASARVYDPEAEDVFGPGYFSLQIQVVKSVIVESTQVLWLEAVENIIESGFDVITGGQMQFRGRLHENQMFLSVINIAVRRGLASPVPPPSPMPSAMLVTGTPTPQPSSEPSFIPSFAPSNKPSRIPSTYPSAAPSASPSFAPSIGPTNVPTAVVTPQNSPAPFSQSQGTPNGSSDDKFDAAIIAAIVGATATLVSACFFLLLIWYRHSRKNKRNKSYPREVALTRDAQGNILPIIVELGDDHLSLADVSTLGEDYMLHRSTRRALASQQDITATGSFDENSLYTTPYDPEESDYRARIIPLPTQSSLSSTSSYARPREFDDYSGGISDFGDSNQSESPFISSSSSGRKNMNRTNTPRNKDATTTSYYMAKSSPKKHTASTRLSIPVDVDKLEPFYEEQLRIKRIEPLGLGLSTVEEDNDGLSSSDGTKSDDHDIDSDFTRDPSELDVW